MSTTNDKLAALTADVVAKSADFAHRMQTLVPSAIVDVGHYSNTSFLLRSFVSLRGDNQGGELAMTVDITRPSSNEEQVFISISSDLSLDDGSVLKTGPSAKLDPSCAGFERQIAAWANEFVVFLSSSELDAANALGELTANKDDSQPRARKPSNHL